MTTFRSEEGLAGLVALGVIPWIVWTVHRGLKNERLPIGRTYVRRDERPAAFTALLLCYLLATLVMIAVASDLLFGLDVRTWL